MVVTLVTIDNDDAWGNTITLLIIGHYILWRDTRTSLVASCDALWGDIGNSILHHVSDDDTWRYICPKTKTSTSSYPFLLSLSFIYMCYNKMATNVIYSDGWYALRWWYIPRGWCT